jgi:hypothetical protein
MKKMMIVLIAAFTFVACNNSAETTATTNDSAAVSVDSTVAVDTTAAGTATPTAE